MKKLILFLILCSFSFTYSFGQTYQPFPDTNAVWRVNWSESSCLMSGYNEARYQYFLLGDTIINTKTYNKIYRDGICSPPCCTPPYSPLSGYIGAFRQDILNKKVFIVLSGDATESLLYDFNLAVGDTIKGLLAAIQTDIIINSIDSIQVGLSYHKKFNFNSGFLIEGIGSTQGLLEPIFTFDAAGDLICFKRNDTALYINPNTFDSCNIVVNSIEILSIKKELILSPNPADKFINLYYENPDKLEIMIGLFNIFGQQIYLIKTREENNLINIELLSTGFYIYKLIGEDEKAFCQGKFIKY